MGGLSFLDRFLGGKGEVEAPPMFFGTNQETRHVKWSASHHTPLPGAAVVGLAAEPLDTGRGSRLKVRVRARRELIRHRPCGRIEVVRHS